MTFGLTPQGFNIKRLADIKLELEAAWQGAFGIGVNIEPSSPAGQMIGISADREANVWMLAQAVYYSMYPDSAQGVQLDNVCALSNIVRLPATKSQVTIRVKGTDTTAVIIGALTVSVLGNALAKFVNKNAFTIAAPGLDEVQKVTFTGTPDAGTFKLTFNGQQTVAINWNDNAATLQTALRNLSSIGAGNVNVTGTFTGGFTITFVSAMAKTLENLVTVSQNSMTVGGNAVGTAVAEITQGTGPYADVAFEGVTAGPTQANIGSLTVIETPTVGIASTVNLVPALLGQNVETDAELRIRRSNELNRSGTATVEGIRNAVRKVAGVTQAVVIENDLDVPDGDGRPAHSFQVIVAGGVNLDIAEAIWASKAGGIATYGNVTVTITDSQGFTHDINFQRPTPVPIYMIVNIVPNTNPSEGAVYPATGDADVKAAIMQYIADFKDGQDVVVNLFFTPINSIPGVIGLTVLVGIAPVPTLPNNIAITATQIATFDPANITVNS